MNIDKTKQTVNLFDKYAQMYQSKYMCVEKYYASLDLFCDRLPSENSKILELACGPGNISKYLLDQKPELDILATDLSPSMLDLAKNNNPKAETQLLDCRHFLQLQTTYDAIVCGFGLPYLSKDDALHMIKDASIALNKGGLIYLSTMEDDYNKSGFKSASSNKEDVLFMYFHEAQYLLNGLQHYGFKIIDISRVIYPDQDGNEVTDLIIIANR